MSRRPHAYLCFPFSVCLALAGCAGTPEQPLVYLDQATGHETEDEVRAELGPPLMQVPGNQGATIWIYRYAGVSSAGTASINEVWCYEHALTFGRDKVLQKWHRQECHQ
jgi:hypothetical protein